MIRLATEHDIPEISRVSKGFYDEIAFGPLVGLYEEEHARNAFVPCNGPNSILLVSDDNGINGVLFMLIFQNTLYQRKIRISDEIVWHTDPKLSAFHRMKIMIALAEASLPILKEKKVSIAYIGTRLKDNAAGRYLEKTGWMESGRRFYREVQ